MPKSDTDSKVSAGQRVELYIKKAIYSGALRPRERIIEDDVAQHLKCSRGPVREALRILELQGLVVHAPRRGFKVKEYAADDLRHLYRLRAQLEGEVINALSAKDVGPLTDALDRTNEAMRGFARKRDLEGYFSANIEFHQLMIESTQSSVLRTIMNQINAMSLPIRFILLLDEFSGRAAYQYHQQITAAIRDRNFRLARRLTMDHITANLVRVVDVYAAALSRQER